MGKPGKRRSRGSARPNAPRQQEPQSEPADSGAAAARPEPTKPDSTAADTTTTSESADAGPPSERSSEPSRRSFFRFAWLSLGGLAIVEFVWVAMNFLRPRLTPEEEAGVVIAGPAERYEPRTVTAFQRGKFYLSRLEDGGFLALSRECTHLGCTVPWIEEESRFVCPCHGSAYNQKGEVVNAPAPRPLDLYPVRIENGIVIVDTSEPQKRLSFAEMQVTQP
jgi:cytochrome b6-f complex iron-sulfur subunit